MAKTITQKIVFKNTTAKVLYDMYMNEKKHSELTGGLQKLHQKLERLILFTMGILLVRIYIL
jgi:hypothetical protein